MKIVADFHIHSKYSRACSRDLTLENIAQTCAIKGVDVVGTGDFTHPEWFKEIKEKLEEKEQGLYVLKLPLPNPPLIKGRSFTTRFILSAEIACIYSKGGKCRRLHIVVLAPSVETAEKINLALAKIGNLKSDGRPILGLDAKELARICFEIDERTVIIPAHIWTPWFAMFGSKSGFDSVEECFEELTSRIFAIETGLSSDPQMNWRIKNLDKISIISNSDAHSLPNIGREANVFEIGNNPSSPPRSICHRQIFTKGRNILYDEIVKVIREKNPGNPVKSAGIKSSDHGARFLETIEFYPEEGMYHFDGHRACNFSCVPSESKKLKNICPVCKKELTIGVLNRVEELARRFGGQAENARDENYVDSSRVPFRKLVELDKIIAEALEIKSRNSKQVQREYKNLVNNLGTEFEILLNTSVKEIAKVAGKKIAEGVRRVRAGELKIKPGFDGQYGEVRIFGEEEGKNKLF